MLVWLALASLAVAVGCRGGQERSSGPAGSQKTGAAPDAPLAAATYVGRGRCAGCHADQDARYKGSHHDLAMQEAGPETVLGDFSGTSFTYAGVTTRFSRKNDVYVVRTDGPGGALQDFQVAYVFGVYPLQQYLVAFPDGRYQVLSVAWDARPRGAGGQRWFHLYPGQSVTHTDVLHWTKFSQNWNAQCAACHSTNLRKGYDRASNRYATTWSELDVSCEACHGPASAHVAWAERRDRREPPSAASAEAMGLTTSLRERRGVQWKMQPSGIAQRFPAGTQRAELDVCAPCHARRSERFDAHVPGQPFLASYRPSLLSDGLYRADGQMQDEVYNYGSFLQSRMHAAGVTCSDCHDPHSLALRGQGNAVCAQCHLPATFDDTSHHGHARGTPGASCVACHMPTETYMVVDRRHDHSFRVPRPDLSAKTGAPDACTRCHSGRTPAWATAAIDQWRTPTWRDRPHFGPVFAAAREGRADAASGLAAIAVDPRQPGIVRATAVELLQRGAPAELEPTLDMLAGDADPLVRMAVVQALPSIAPAARARVGARLLADPMRVVRADAASALSDEATPWLTAEQRGALEQARAESASSDLFNGDRPESFLNLGLVAEQQGDTARAREEYEAATRYAPWFVPAYVNLADLDRRAGNEAAAEQTLRRGLAAVPDEAPLLYALGLGLYRQQRGAEAVQTLGRAARRAPEVPRYALAYALALEAHGRAPEAVKVLDGALKLHPDDRNLLEAALGLAQKSGDMDRSRAYVRRLLVVAPDDPALVPLARSLGVM